MPYCFSLGLSASGLRGFRFTSDFMWTGAGVEALMSANGLQAPERLIRLWKYWWIIEHSSQRTVDPHICVVTLHLEVIGNLLADIVHRRLRLEMHLVWVEGVVLVNFKFDFDGLRYINEVLFAILAHHPVLFGTEHLIEDCLVVEELFTKLTEILDMVEALHAYVVGVNGLHPKLKREAEMSLSWLIRVHWISTPDAKFSFIFAIKLPLNNLRIRMSLHDHFNENGVPLNCREHFKNTENQEKITLFVLLPQFELCF